MMERDVFEHLQERIIFIQKIGAFYSRRKPNFRNLFETSTYKKMFNIIDIVSPIQITKFILTILSPKNSDISYKDWREL